jgi:hypothetical protein
LLGIGAEREAIAKAVAEERAAVVAYLRMEADDGAPMAASALLDVSDAIERGEHRREEEQ